MRYQITLPSTTEGGLDTVLSETDHLDLAEATARHAPFDVALLDTFTHRIIPVHRVRYEGGVQLTTDQLPWDTIDYLLNMGRKIAAIKLIRSLTSFGLGEAKTLADQRADKLAREY